MKNNSHKLSRTLAAGAVAAALTALSAAPARANAAPSPGSTTGPSNPNLGCVQIHNAKPDLFLESLAAKDLGGGKFQITATLRNVACDTTYPGGGTLAIRRTSGGTILNNPGDPNSLFLAAPDPGQLLASKPIPPLPYGQAVQLSAVTAGRAIFTASADSDVDKGPLPESNPSNNTRTLNLLISHQIVINDATIQTFLGSLLSGTKLRLDSLVSLVSIPGVLLKTWQIPVLFSFDIPPTPADPFGATAHWYVNDINLNGIGLAIENGGLSLSMSFETDGPEIHAVVDGLSLVSAPDLNADPLEVKFKMPLSYDPGLQLFSYHDPHVEVNAHWTASGLLGGLVPDSLLKQINPKLQQLLEDKLNDPALQAPIAFQLNQKIRTLLLNGGRIVSATIKSNEVDMTIETP